MKAKHVTMQLGTQYMIDGKRGYVATAEIAEFITDVVTPALIPINGGFVTREGLQAITNIGLHEPVYVISFVLPVTDTLTAFMNTIGVIQHNYCARFHQERIVTIITDCEAVL